MIGQRMRVSTLIVASLFVVVAVQVPLGGRPRPAGPTGGPIGLAGTWMVSETVSGARGNTASFGPSVSGTGRYIAFASAASTFVDGDTNGANDVFVQDRFTVTLTRVSVATDGSQGAGGSDSPSISGDGRYVAFSSTAANLVPGDSNVAGDIFVRDRVAGTTTRVSVGSGGTQANGHSFDPSMSGDGRYVAFSSFATNLVSGDTNDSPDVFVHDRQTGNTIRASTTGAGGEADGLSYTPALSFDGRVIVFVSSATNLASSTPFVNDVFRKDLVQGHVTLVSRSTAGVKANGHSHDPSVSRDGMYIAFASDATNLIASVTPESRQVYVHSTDFSTTIMASVTPAGLSGDGDSNAAAIAPSGNVVAFQSLAADLVAGDGNGREDVFVRDLVSGTTVVASAADSGALGNEVSRGPAVSADGSAVAFRSAATNLVTSGDSNGVEDVFARRWRKPRPGFVDFDGDGYGDIFGTKLTGAWTTWRGLGNGRMAEAEADGEGPVAPLAVGKLAWSKNPQGGDFNGDGLSDIFDYKPVSGVWQVAWNTGAGGFTATTGKFGLGYKTTVVDLNLDGRSDVLLMNGTTGKYEQCLMRTDGTFACTVTTAAGGAVPMLAHGNRWAGSASTPDLFVHRKTAGVATWLVNNGNGTFGQAFAGTMPKDWPGYVADFTGDGLGDILLYRPTGKWWLGVHVMDAGTSSIVMQPLPPTKWPAGQQVFIGDLDEDGRPDIVLHKPKAAAVYLRYARDGGTWEELSAAPAAGTRVVAITDLDLSDGDDVVFYDKLTGLYEVMRIYRHGGGANWRENGMLAKGLLLVVHQAQAR